MVTSQDIFNILCTVYAEKWDNNGIIVGDENKKIENIVIAMDVTEDVISQCKNGDLLITHHPLIFNPIKTVKSDDLVYKLIKRDITCMALHTMLDYNKCTLVHLRRNLSTIINALNSGEFYNDDRIAIGIKYIAKYNNNKPFYNIVKDYMNLLKTNNPFLYYNSNNYLNDTVKVGFIQGSANSFIDQVINSKIELFITGELNYHNILRLTENNIDVMLLGHKTSENFLLDYIQQEINKKYPDLNSTVIKDQFEGEIIVKQGD
jgi:dinuclear metal center YbgI/SA1388 family protein